MVFTLYNVQEPLDVEIYRVRVYGNMCGGYRLTLDEHVNVEVIGEASTWE